VTPLPTALTRPLAPLDAVARRAVGALAGVVDDSTLSASRMIALVRRTASRSHPMVEQPPPRWQGSGPVVLVGGFCATDTMLGPMRHWLERLGYDVRTHTLAAGMDCAGRSVQAVQDRIRRAADEHGGPVRVVAHSRGGQFARAAVRRLVRDGGASGPLVTLGTPLDLYGAHRILLLQAAAVAAAGSLGAPGLARLACFYGPCCAEFRDELREPVPVPCTAVFSREDRFVPWRASVDPAARNVEVPGSHLGLLVDPPALCVVADALAGGEGPSAITTVAREYACAA
jgi:hypothetical protein